jgi:hypothetical protein
MGYIIGAVVIFVAGFFTCFFILKNNPKYLNVEKLTKDELKELLEKVQKKL